MNEDDICCAADRRSWRYSAEEGIIHNGPINATAGLFDTAIFNVRRWLRDSRSVECNVDIAVLAGVLAPPGCYNGSSQEAEEIALYGNSVLMRASDGKNWVVACRLVGSSTEGLTAFGDTDVMWIAEHLISDVIPMQFPGYYHIRQSRLRVFGDEEFVRSDVIKKKYAVTHQNDLELSESGPSLKSLGYFSGHSEDHVLTLQWNKWPADMDHKQFTSELYQKLQPFVKESAIKGICALPRLFVPVSHPMDRADAYGWRLSFSIHEREILKNFIDPERKRVYCLLRCIVRAAKEATRTLSAIKNYYIKTEFLWLASEAGCENWNLMDKFVQLCQRLETALLGKSMRNFFIPQQNLIGHVTGNRLRSAATWIRLHLLSESGRRETFLAVLHGLCQCTHMTHSPFRSAIQDCASSYLMALTLKDTLYCTDWYVSLLHQVSQMLSLPPSTSSDVNYATDFMPPVRNASVDAVFEIKHFIDYINSRDSCCFSHGADSLEFNATSVIHMLQLAWVSNDRNHENLSTNINFATERQSSLSAACSGNGRASQTRLKRRQNTKLTLRSNQEKIRRIRCSRKMSHTRKSHIKRELEVQYEQMGDKYNWRLTNAMIKSVTINGNLIDFFHCDLELFQGSKFLAKISVKSHVLPLWSGGYYPSLDYQTLGTGLLFALHAFRCYRSPCIVTFALQYLDWLDEAGGTLDMSPHEYLREREMRVVRELMETMREFIDQEDWKRRVQPFIDSSTMLMRREVVRLLLCAMAEFHHRNEALRQKCQLLKDFLIFYKNLDEIRLTPFEEVIVKFRY